MQEPPQFAQDEVLTAAKLNRLVRWVISALPTFAPSSGLVQTGQTVKVATPRGGRYAKVNSGGITAGSGNVLGFGSIRLYDRDTTSTNGRTLVDSGVNADCYNRGGSVGSGHQILVEWVDNAWSVVVDIC